ncbi:uncharacterized protein LOC121426653 [Lytechinus variegatus]|uniref:uncharacterized protein LOC121426653 n=1 Tax=Lytechinus variegatus TaxID=7654 RepID=UPI001BB15CB3|nr:uncharacterized protein LOC121426653 [Lytechinus variegatus]
MSTATIEWSVQTGPCENAKRKIDQSNLVLTSVLSGIFKITKASSVQLKFDKKMEGETENKDNDLEKSIEDIRSKMIEKRRKKIRADLSQSRSRNKNANLALKTSLRLNNRTLAKSLSVARKEYHLAESELVELQRERLNLRLDISRLKAEHDKQRTQIKGVHEKLRKVTSNLMDTVGLLGEAMDMCTHSLTKEHSRSLGVVSRASSSCSSTSGSASSDTSVPHSIPSKKDSSPTCDTSVPHTSPSKKDSSPMGDTSIPHRIPSKKDRPASSDTSLPRRIPMKKVTKPSVHINPDEEEDIKSSTNLKPDMGIDDEIDLDIPLRFMSPQGKGRNQRHSKNFNQSLSRRTSSMLDPAVMAAMATERIQRSATSIQNLLEETADVSLTSAEEEPMVCRDSIEGQSKVDEGQGIEGNNDKRDGANIQDISEETGDISTTIAEEQATVRRDSIESQIEVDVEQCTKGNNEKEDGSCTITNQSDDGKVGKRRSGRLTKKRVTYIYPDDDEDDEFQEIDEDVVLVQKEDVKQSSSKRRSKNTNGRLSRRRDPIVIDGDGAMDCGIERDLEELALLLTDNEEEAKVSAKPSTLNQEVGKTKEDELDTHHKSRRKEATRSKIPKLSSDKIEEKKKKKKKYPHKPKCKIGTKKDCNRQQDEKDVQQMTVFDLSMGDSFSHQTPSCKIPKPRSTTRTNPDDDVEKDKMVQEAATSVGSGEDSRSNAPKWSCNDPDSEDFADQEFRSRVKNKENSGEGKHSKIKRKSRKSKSVVTPGAAEPKVRLSKKALLEELSNLDASYFIDVTHPEQINKVAASLPSRKSSLKDEGESLNDLMMKPHHKKSSKRKLSTRNFYFGDNDCAEEKRKSRLDRSDLEAGELSSLNISSLCLGNTNPDATFTFPKTSADLVSKTHSLEQSAENPDSTFTLPKTSSDSSETRTSKRLPENPDSTFILPKTSADSSETHASDSEQWAENSDSTFTLPKTSADSSETHASEQSAAPSIRTRSSIGGSGSGEEGLENVGNSSSMKKVEKINEPEVITDSKGTEVRKVHFECSDHLGSIGSSLTSRHSTEPVQICKTESRNVNEAQNSHSHESEKREEERTNALSQQTFKRKHKSDVDENPIKIAKTDIESALPERTGRRSKAVSYKEPSLSSKLRQGDRFTSTVYKQTKKSRKKNEQRTALGDITN